MASSSSIEGTARAARRVPVTVVVGGPVGMLVAAEPVRYGILVTVVEPLYTVVQPL